jgi:hypothetical protein
MTAACYYCEIIRVANFVDDLGHVTRRRPIRVRSGVDVISARTLLWLLSTIMTTEVDSVMRCDSCCGLWRRSLSMMPL